MEGRILLSAAVSEFPIRTTGGGSVSIALGSDNNLWFTESSNNVGRLNPTTGAIAQYPIPTPNSAPGAIIDGPDGNLWFIEAASNQFGVVNPSTGAITEVPVLPANASQIQDLASDPADGDIWFTEYKSNKIGEIDPKTHVVNEFAIPTAFSEPYGITYDPVDQDIWFAESGTNKIGMIDPATHAIADYTIATSGNAQAEGIAADSSGNLWFAEAGAGAIGSFNPSTHAVNTYSSGIISGAVPGQIALGPDGNLWFDDTTTQNYYGYIGTISPGSPGTIKQYQIGFQVDGGGIVSGADGKVHFAESNGVGTITTTGQITSASIPGTSSLTPGSIVAGADGNLWFAQQESGNSENDQIGVIAPGTETSVEYPGPDTNNYFYYANQIALNPTDGTLWFTESAEYGGTSKIGKINPTTRAFSTSITVPTSGAGVQGIAFDRSNGLFWFAEQGGNTIGEVNPTTGAIADTFLTLPSGSDPYGIVADSSGNLWFTEYGTGKVAVYNPTTEVVTQIALASANAHPEGIAVGPDGNIWFVETGGGFPSATDQIGVINPKTDALIKEIPAPATGSIAPGPTGDGGLYFTEGSAIGRIATSGYAITTFPVADATPEGVAAGPDGNVWFTGEGTSFPNYYPNITGTVDLAPVATASTLAVATEPPSTVTAGKGFGLVVAVDNAAGNIDAYYNGPVTIALGANPGGSTLSGTLTETAVDGVAAFPGLSLNNTGSGYTIVASVSGVGSVASDPITVGQAATHLVITEQPPASSPIGTVFTVDVAAEDDSGDVDTSYNGTLAIALGNNPGNATLSGTTLLGASDGVASFSGLSLNQMGNDDTLVATDTAGLLRSATTNGFNVTPAPATHLVFTVEPAPVETAGSPFEVDLTAENDLGQVDPNFDQKVDLELTGGASGASLFGTVSETASAGVATFPGLSVRAAGFGYQIQAGGGGLTGSTASFGVTAGSVVSFGLIPSWSNNKPSVEAPYSLQVYALDQYANVNTTYNGTVQWASTDPKATLPAAYTFKSGDAGGHLFSGVEFATLGARTITVSDKANGSIKGTGSFTVVAATTGASVISSVAEATLGRAVTLTAAIVQAAPGAGIPTGTVTFTDGSTTLGTAKLDGTGHASITLSNLTLGTHSIQVSYPGDPADSASKSSTLSLHVGDTPQVDFDGDGKPDVVVYGPDPRIKGQYDFRILTSSSGFSTSKEVYFPNNGTGFGNAQSVPVPADYFGEGKSAYAIWTPSVGSSMTFSAISSVTGKSVSFSFGDDTDIPLVGEFDGDGKAEFAIYGKDPTDGKYDFHVLFFSSSATGTVNAQVLTFDDYGAGFGNANSIPMLGDFSGNGHSDFAIFTPSASGSTFTYVDPDTKGTLTRTVGAATDTPEAVDVDGDGRTDLVLYGPDPARAGQYRYLALTSGSGFNTAGEVAYDNDGSGYGNSTSTPATVDYQGTGKADFGLFTPDGHGGMEYVYQANQTGQGITLDFAFATDLAVDAPWALNAKKVRGK